MIWLSFFHPYLFQTQYSILILLPTMNLSLFPISSDLWDLFLICDFILSLNTIQRETARQNILIKHWNNIFIFTTTTNKIIGQIFFYLQSLLITIYLVLLLASPYFLQIKTIIQTSKYIQNVRLLFFCAYNFAIDLFLSTICYMGHESRLWQLLHNYVHAE